MRARLEKTLARIKSVTLVRPNAVGYRQCLIQFLQILLLYLQAGYELKLAWLRALSELSDKKRKSLFSLQLPEFGTLYEHLDFLAQRQGHDEKHWWRVLYELYGKGAPLVPALKNFVDTLVVQDQADWIRRERQLPLKMNVILIVFFLPPTLLLFIVPLVLALRQAAS